MAEGDPGATKVEKSRQSPYWIGKHKRGFLSSLALLGVVSAAGFSLLGVNKSKDTASEGLVALKGDRACLEIIGERAKPGADTATVPLASLTPQQQAACRVNDLPLKVNVSQYNGYGPQLHATIVNPTVELPDRQSLEAAEAQDLQDSRTGKWDDLPFDVGMGFIAVPGMVFLATSMLTGDAFEFNRRNDTPHREQTAVSA